jgi:hypothetical protein
MNPACLHGGKEGWWEEGQGDKRVQVYEGRKSSAKGRRAGRAEEARRVGRSARQQEDRKAAKNIRKICGAQRVPDRYYEVPIGMNVSDHT